jgi:glycosyltransferase involved in cell wall biosynthesis
MRLLYVFPEPLPLPRARGIQVAHTVAALARADISVHLAYVPSADDADPLSAYGVERPDAVALVPLSRGLSAPLSWLPLRSNRLFFRRLRGWIENESGHHRRPALIMARHLKIAHALLDAFPDIPLLYEAHEVFAEVAPPDKRERLARIEESVLRRAAALVAVTHGVADDLKKRYRLDRDIHVLPDAVSWPAQIPEKPWHEAGRHVVYAGSFFPWKGAQDLVAAAEWLPGCRIELIGGSPERIREYQGQVPAHGAEVVFSGHLRHTETLKALSEACIAVLPNRAEPNSLWSSPLKLFEYMAAGCAVVAADLPSVREVLAEDEAVWAAPGDPRALAVGIRRLVDNPEQARRLGEGLRERAKRYTWEARARQLVAIMRAGLS